MTHAMATACMLHFYTLKHVSVGIVSDGEDVRWHFSPSLSPVHVNHLW